MKKPAVIIGVVVLVLALIIGGVIYAKGGKKQAEETKKIAPIAEKVNEIPVAERPYVELAPTAAGREIILTIHEVRKPAQEVEYELEYQSGTLLQAAFGKLPLNSFPITKQTLLGSRSAGGKTTYHEDVTGGTLLLRFMDPDKYVLKNDWAFIENKTKEPMVGSRDGKFQLESPAFSKVTHTIILQTPGLPENPEQKVVSLGYGVAPLTPVTGKVKVSLRLSEDVPAATILGWDGSAWKTLKTTVADKVAHAEDVLYQAYVAVEQL